MEKMARWLRKTLHLLTLSKAQLEVWVDERLDDNPCLYSTVVLQPAVTHTTGFTPAKQEKHALAFKPGRIGPTDV